MSTVPWTFEPESGRYYQEGTDESGQTVRHYLDGNGLQPAPWPEPFSHGITLPENIQHQSSLASPESFIEARRLRSQRSRSQPSTDDLQSDSGVRKEGWPEQALDSPFTYHIPSSNYYERQPHDINTLGHSQDSYSEESEYELVGKGGGQNGDELGSDFVKIAKPSRFFRVGRVIKVLWTEPAGASTTKENTLFISGIGHGQKGFSKFRRFIVIRERLHCCLCLPIFTYGGQGAAKNDVRSQDHAVVYAVGEPQPTTLREEAIEKDAISIILEHPTEKLDPMSRLDFSRVYTVEHNIRVLKIGRVSPTHLERLNNYFVDSILGSKTSAHPSEIPQTPEELYNPRQTTRMIKLWSKSTSDWISISSISDGNIEENWISRTVSSRLGLEEVEDPIIKSLTLGGSSFTSRSTVVVRWREDLSNTPTSIDESETAFFVIDNAPFDLLFGSSLDYTRTVPSYFPPEPITDPTDSKSYSQIADLRRITGSPGGSSTLDPSYRVRKRDYERFFRPGRVFSTLWTDPYTGNFNGSTETFGSSVSVVAYNERVHSKVRRFVVVRKGDRSCTCLPVTSYDGRGYKMVGINLGEHCFIYSNRRPKQVEGITKHPLKLILSKGAQKLADNWLVNFSKLYTVETNVKVKDIGELDTDSKKLLQKYFKETFFESDDELDAPPRRSADLAGVGAAMEDVGGYNYPLSSQLDLSYQSYPLGYQPQYNINVDPHGYYTSASSYSSSSSHNSMSYGPFIPSNVSHGFLPQSPPSANAGTLSAGLGALSMSPYGSPHSSSTAYNIPPILSSGTSPQPTWPAKPRSRRSSLSLTTQSDDTLKARP